METNKEKKNHKKYAETPFLSFIRLLVLWTVKNGKIKTSVKDIKNS
jgi:hypothetical protein